MKYLDRRDNRDIIEYIRRRYFIKGSACAFLALFVLVFFYLYGFAYFSDRMGTVNSIATCLVCMALPFFALKLHKDVFDKSWEGKVLKRESHRVAKGVVKISSRVETYIRLSVQTGNDIRIVDGPADKLNRFVPGTRIRHIRGTKHNQLWQKDRIRTDCVMCGKAAPNTFGTCPHCGFSLVKFDLPEEKR